MSQILLQYLLSLLFLNLKRSFELLELSCYHLLELMALDPVLVQNSFNLFLVHFGQLVCLDHLVHFHQALSSHLDLVENVHLHANVVILVLTEKSTV